MSQKELIIEEAKASDAVLIKHLLADLSQETTFITNDSKEMSLEVLEESLSISEASLNSICLLAKLEGQLIGLLNVVGSESSYTGHIGDLFIAVKKAYTGYGIGHTLMELACDWAQHSPMIKRLELTVQARNERAIKLYQDFEFEIEGVKKRALRLDDGRYIDLLMMSKWIGDDKA
ncbi:GNAT family N-acetyltransferase [Streptococcus pluranimalium]|uniref:GNAT family N-acetyltransferase n=1 Tax=Streptococcus pluranimalium TaxID=82348 RepID=UPI0039FCAC5A